MTEETKSSESRELSGLGSYFYWVFTSIFSLSFVGFMACIVRAKDGLSVSIFKTFRLFICLLIFLSMIAIAVMVIKNQNVCGNNIEVGEAIGKAFGLLILPFSFIFGLGAFALETFPGWIRGFSNTFGTSFLHLGSIKTFLQNNMNNNDIMSKFYHDPLPMFKEITLEGYKVENESIKWPQVDSLIQKGVFNPDGDKDKFMIELSRYIMTKDSVAYCIWYILLGIITIQSTIIMILNDNDCLRGAKDNKSFSKFMKT